eukprot:TRINITY_DN337_c0_g5_i1.p1 TRINITY_DN337_c0_g5~~TRINITY_DN337_c0_g5_i1.p1  ORF type:complete len:615 (+),score=156.71 TRINITY_DN337_c0_g5_i1:84-1928(+)
MTTNQIHNSTSLYVGELASDISESHLYAIFSTVGLVSSIRVCRDALTRRSLGYAYVNYHSPYDASEALDRFNNQPIGSGKPCRIMYSQRDPSLRKSGVGNIFIKNLNKSIDHKSLFDTFSAFGNILSCKIATDEHGNSKGYGFVQFESQETADKAIEKVNSMMLMDKQVFVGKFIPKKERMKFRENQDFTNVYVKNLPENSDQNSLTDLFKGFGLINSVAVKSTIDKLKFGFVDFSNPADARKAVAEMNGKQVSEGDQPLYVARAQKKAERQAELKYRFQHEQANKYQGVNLYIKNLSEDVTDARLKQEFGQFGTITSAEVMKDDKGNSKGFGFVCFSTPEEASKAIQEMNNQLWDSKPIYVALAQRKEVRKAQLQALRQNKGSHVFSGAGPIYSGQQGSGPNVFYPPQNQYNIYPSAQVVHAPRGGRGGWQNSGYPREQYNASRGPRHHRGQGPQGGYPHRGQRFQNSRGGSGARGDANNANADFQQHAPQHTPQPVQPAPQQPVDSTPELTLDGLKQLPKDEQFRVIGEHLFALVEKTLVGKVPAEKLENSELAGKITGMLLDNLQQGTGSPEDLLLLVNDESALNLKINEALAVLEAHSTQPAADETPANQ